MAVAVSDAEYGEPQCLERDRDGAFLGQEVSVRVVVRGDDERRDRVERPVRGSRQLDSDQVGRRKDADARLVARAKTVAAVRHERHGTCRITPATVPTFRTPVRIQLRILGSTAPTWASVRTIRSVGHLRAGITRVYSVTVGYPEARKFQIVRGQPRSSVVLRVSR